MLQLIEQRKLRLHKVIAAVIDEADEMLQEKESMDTIRDILSHAPSEIQLVFFSATKAPVFNEFHQWFGIEPQVIDVSDQDITGGQVTHYLLETPTRKRVDMCGKSPIYLKCTPWSFSNKRQRLKKLPEAATSSYSGCNVK